MVGIIGTIGINSLAADRIQQAYNIIWDRKRNKFINGETIWYNVEDVIPDLGYEEDFIKLERAFA